MNTTIRDMRISPMSWLMKLAFGFVALNALAGAGSLMFFPAQTHALFFWEIKPAINAALFGALYLGGALATGWLIWRGQWESARFLIPVLVCAGGLITIITALHLDKFAPGIKLTYWLVVYIGAPLLALLFYIQHEQAGADWSVKNPVKPITRAIAITLGSLLAALGLLILIWPSVVLTNWPWPTGALMIRVFAAWFIAFGVGLLWFWVEREWTRVQHIANLMIGAAVLDLLMVFLHRADIATTGLSLWVYCFHLALFGCVGLLMHGLQHDAQRAVSFSSSPQVSAR